MDTIGRPTRVDFIFSRPLEGPRYRFLHFVAGRYVPWQLPEVGDTVKLEAIPQ